MQFKKRIKAIFVRPKRKLADVMPEFQQLRQALQCAFKVEDPLTGIVHFFDNVSKWHDRGIGDLIAAFERVNYGQYDKVQDELETLQGYFIRAGRDMCGWNRTKPGQTVTDDNIYLGDIFGLRTKTVRFWKQRKDEKKGGWGFSNMGHLNAYDVVSLQARGFMDSHTEPMIGIINGLEVAI